MNRRKFLKGTLAGAAAVVAAQAHSAVLPGRLSTGPIRLHPDNPHYFLWRGKPTVLITAGEHYGAVLNLDFNYVRYLHELEAHRFNLTRIFSGAYREVAGSFNITGNTLAPASGRFVCPWARSGNKFDLTKWDDTYFERMKDFITKANDRGVAVELVLFCPMYADEMWEASPMNAHNNVNGIGNVTRQEIYSGKYPDLLDVQRRMVRKLVNELNGFDNLYYEVCNEPYERGGLTTEWNDLIIETIVETEATSPKKHLIAQNFPPSSHPVSNLNPKVSILNFHGAKPEAVRLNYALNHVIAFDETGGSDRSDRKYRTEGWNWIMSGGGVYDHLDFSFTTDRPDGSLVPLPSGTPGGGGLELRKQLRILKEFIEGFNFVRMAPGDDAVKGKRIAGSENATVCVLAEAGEAYAIYVSGGTGAELLLALPAGNYRAEWINTRTGKLENGETFSHTAATKALSSPAYTEDIALRIRRRN